MVWAPISQPRAPRPRSSAASRTRAPSSSGGAPPARASSCSASSARRSAAGRRAISASHQRRGAAQAAPQLPQRGVQPVVGEVPPAADEARGHEHRRRDPQLGEDGRGAGVEVAVAVVEGDGAGVAIERQAAVDGGQRLGQRQHAERAPHLLHLAAEGGGRDAQRGRDGAVLDQAIDHPVVAEHVDEGVAARRAAAADAHVEPDRRRRGGRLEECAQLHRRPRRARRIQSRAVSGSARFTCRRRSQTERRERSRSRGRHPAPRSRRRTVWRAPVAQLSL